MSEEGTGGAFIIGLLAGAAVGIAVGFLYAPKSGEQTRALIRDKAVTTKERAEDIIEEAKERAKKIIADARGKAAEITSEPKETVS